jgi:hypothetical protein
VTLGKRMKQGIELHRIVFQRTRGRWTRATRSHSMPVSTNYRYTYIPTIALLPGLRAEGFSPFMVCQTWICIESARAPPKTGNAAPTRRFDYTRLRECPLREISYSAMHGNRRIGN